MVIEFKNILETDENTIEQVRQWRNSENINKYMLSDKHISKDEHQQWVVKLKKENSKAWLIIYNKQFAGLAYLSNIDYDNKTTEWGFYIADESVRGKGVGSAALYKLMEYVFEGMKFNKMSTMVLENNIIAVRLYEKFGFKKEGMLKQQLERDGKLVNVIIMGISKERWDDIKRVEV